MINYQGDCVLSKENIIIEYHIIIIENLNFKINYYFNFKHKLIPPQIISKYECFLYNIS